MSAFTRLVARLPRLTLVAIDVGVAAALVVVVALEDSSVHQPLPAVVVGLAVPVTVCFRRRAPVVATVLNIIGLVLLDHLGGHGESVLPAVLPLNFYMVGRRSSERGWGPIDAVLLLVPLPAIATSPPTSLPSVPLVIAVLWVWALFLVVPFAAGRTVGGRSVLNAQLRANTQRLVDEQRDRARHAATQERIRIARELHDIVAHSVSVMVIQTAAARRVAGQDPSAARHALRAVESCGRDALADLRRMVGVLHRDDIEVLGGATPGLAQLEKLAERARASGLPVQVSVEGVSRPLSSALDLVSYRIVQEALTNAIKHAGRAEASVRVIFMPAWLELEVVDTGCGSLEPSAAATALDSVGHGLVGMRERLALYGGTLHAGSRSSGGFEVRARLPLSESAMA